MVAKQKEERAQTNHVRPAESEMAPPRFTLFDVRQLIALINTTDLAEIVIERPEQGMRLALRRAPVPVVSAAPAVAPNAPAPSAAPGPATPAAEEEQFEYVTAPLVGVFHPALKAGQKPLVAVGDVIREGQVIGGIETLRVMNEVEAQVSGKVVKILVEPGQGVEYGHPLLAVIPNA